MSNKKNISIGAAIAVLAAAYIGIDLKQSDLNTAPNTQIEVPATTQSARPVNSNKKNHQYANDIDRIQQAFQNHQSDMQVQAQGKVIAVLRDDNEGSRHQKFLLELANGQTVLVAHNIDLAPRIEAIQKGDKVEFLGEYEYSDKGGVIHWTHRDPSDQHVAGWLKHQGRTYQ